MKKIILIGSEGILGSYYKKKLLASSKLLVTADIKIKKNKLSKKLIELKLDVEKDLEIRDFFFKIKKNYGSFDVLIYNAALTTEGIMKNFKKANNNENFETKIWDKTLNINLRGNFLCCKYFIKYHLKSSKFQKIINVGSIYGSNSPHHEIYKNEDFFSSLAYSAGKSGIIGMTKWLATKFANKKTTCNMISPAGVENNQKVRWKKKYLKLIPANKMANQQDIFGALEFLISDRSNYVNGQNLHVDGGFSAW